MKLIKNTYRTLSGKSKVYEIPDRKPSQWLIYEDNKPRFYVDLYDLSIESNSMMNSLVLCGKRSIKETLDLVNKKNNTHLSLPVISRLGIYKIIKTAIVDIELEYLPEEWLDYSL